MNSMKIGTYQMDTSFGLYLPEYTIPAPAPQTKFVKIIGRDGSVDLSEAIGLHYDSRNWSLDFKHFDPTVNWHTLSSNVMNAIHGKRLNFEFDDDPDYFWTGRISVSSYVSNRGTGTLRVNITSDPYKYKKLSTIVTKTASTGTVYTGSLVTFNGGLVYDLSTTITPTQSGSGDPSPTNVRPISGLTGLSVYVSPTQYPDDATVYNVDLSTQAGTVYGGTVDVVTGRLTVNKAYKAFDGTEDWGIVNGAYFMTVVGALNSVVNDSAISTHYLDNPNISGGNYQLGFRCFNRSSSPYAGAAVLVRPEAPLTTSLADFKAWLATQNTNGTPFAVCYELATPQTYQLIPTQIEALTGANNIWSNGSNVTVTVVTPETVTNNGSPAVPTVTASADMVLRWGNYSASVQQGTSTIPQLVLQNGANLICIIGTGTISFEWSEASL